MSGPSDAIRPNAPPATDERMVGRQFLAALRARDFSTITALFADESEFRALVPAGLREGRGPGEATGWFRRWFGKPTSSKWWMRAPICSWIVCISATGCACMTRRGGG